MRKTLMIFLALVLVCGCGAAFAAQAVSAPREEILFQEHIFSGDPAAADGLTVQLKTGMRYKLNWESTVQFSAQDYRAETSFRFLPAGQAEQPEMSYRGVEINFYRDAATTGSDDVFGFSTAYQSLLDTLSPGESGSMTIRFADYYDEYPFEFSIDLPGVNYDPLVNWQDASADSEWLGERAQVALGCFFRIPVLQDEYVELGIDKNMDGQRLCPEHLQCQGGRPVLDERRKRYNGRHLLLLVRQPDGQRPAGRHKPHSGRLWRLYAPLRGRLPRIPRPARFTAGTQTRSIPIS